MGKQMSSNITLLPAIADRKRTPGHATGGTGPRRARLRSGEGAHQRRWASGVARREEEQRQGACLARQRPSRRAPLEERDHTNQSDEGLRATVDRPAFARPSCRPPQRLNQPQPSVELVPTGEIQAHQLQVVDSTRPNLQSQIGNRTAQADRLRPPLVGFD